MPWNTPANWVAGTVLSAAQLNSQLRDNLNLLKTNISDNGDLKGENFKYANAGTSTSAGATNLDSIAISGLTAKDQIVVEFFIGSVVQQTTSPITLVSVTDSNALLASLSPDIAGGTFTAGNCTLMQGQDGATIYTASVQSFNSVSGTFDGVRNNTVTTSWLTGFTLGLRISGVVAGGTCRYRWAVYKRAGQ